MTEERLEEIEEALDNFILVDDDGAVLNGAVMELVAEIRSLWRRIVALEAVAGASEGSSSGIENFT